jgi:hypothetical protein
MKKILTSVIFASSILLTGCSTLESISDATAYKKGTKVTQIQIDEFENNKSSKNTIISILGEPQKTTDNSIEYHYQQINHLSSNEDYVTIFTFNEKDELLAIKKRNGSFFNNPLTGN